MEQKIIVDTHSHVGIDLFHGESKFNDYVEFAKNNEITNGLLMAVPSPYYKGLDEKPIRYMYWKYINGQMQYFGNKNPFKEVNLSLFKKISRFSDNQLSLYFVLAVHPVLDEIEYLEEMIELTNPVAIKIHGIGSGVGPDNISKELIELIKKYNLPIIVHTDYDRGIANSSVSMQYVRRINNSYEWARFFINNEIKGILNHGANLDERTFELVNKTEWLKVALGPDLIACQDSNRLATHENVNNAIVYLNILKSSLASDKILFDIDYNWNQIPNTSYLDESSIDRVRSVWDENDQRKILGENAITFFNKLPNQLVKRRKK